MTTRTGARVYRRAPKPVNDGCCPGCNRRIRPHPTTHRYRDHRTKNGDLCTYSGVQVEPDTVIALVSLPPIRHYQLDERGEPLRTNTGRPVWEAKPYRRSTPTEIKQRRRELHPLDYCPECGRKLAINPSGNPRRHRIEADNPLAPYCSVGNTPR